eukprot:TRINITY_DN13733_c0_g1_i7.p1 TRINITY_DN13733_c0_g1~~TRINITY_DN13733_c0_g1_i7.p1  ORF type:complete len:227 (+),score=38.65 TRINITY_DN13733_c0_g1_i7:70-750(+)
MAQSAPFVDSTALETQLLSKLIVRTTTHGAMQRLAKATTTAAAEEEAGAALVSGSGLEKKEPDFEVAAHVGDGDPSSCVESLPDLASDEAAPRPELPRVVADFAIESEEGQTTRGAQSAGSTTVSTHWTSPVVADFASESEEGHTSRGDRPQRARPTTASTHWPSPSGSLPTIEEADFEDDDASSCASSELSEHDGDERTYAARLERSHLGRIDTFDSLASILKRR